VGYIKGSDPVLNSECVVYSTHWDGYGIGIPQNGDSIYNAAKDNAGGISEMLAIAKTMHAMAKDLRRSVVFIASTAEESGKLGAEAYVRSPLFPLNKTALAIGMDIFSPWGRATVLGNTGYGYTTMDTIFRSLGQKRGLPYVEPHISSFSASDQYMFARRGVPSVFASVGSESLLLSDAAIDSIEAASKVHTPFDEIFPVWNLESAAVEAGIMFEAGVIVANKTLPPRWLVNNEFTTTRHSLKNK
jgi:Zn-dependent M28 family amino/carboxypeptidase